ncbi:MAG: VWA domain-containing protein [Deltaproteobacteria bacterium]|nr:VWA domain-containing protein [Deltaproteobacteria bacterium]MCB9787450.1 VWA domain-containing protein [Deltaproteobacteria bacterium]
MSFALMSIGEMLTLFGALGGAMVLLYVLKLRRRRVEVPFAPLWARLVEERQSSALFRRLRRLLSLLVQLTILALIVLAMGDPRLSAGQGCGFEPAPPPPERHTLLLLDSSASMATFERGRTRMERGAAKANAVIDALGANPAHRVMVAAVDTDLRPLTLWTSDRAQAHAAVASWLAAGARDTATDIPHALELARDVLRGRAGAETVLVSDAAWEPPSAALAEAVGLSVEQVGEPGANVGIEALNVRPYLDDSLTYALFYAVRNTGPRPLRATLYLYANEEGRSPADFIDDARIVASVALTLPARGVARDVLGDLEFEGSRLAARVVIDPAEDTADPLARDDVALALVPPRRRLRVQLVSEGNLFVQASLLVRENVDFEAIAPADYRGPEGYDVTIVDRADVDISRPGRYLMLDPAPGDDFRITGSVEEPTVAHVAQDHPLARGLVLADLGIPSASRFERRDGDTTVASAEDGTPLLFVRDAPESGRSFVVLPFDLTRSLLPVNYAFPLLVVNALNWFQPQPDGLVPTHHAGRTVSLPATLPEGPLTVSGPPEAGPVEARRLADRIALRADRAGIYELSTPGAEEPLRVALNLMDPAESVITPRAELPAWSPPAPWTPASPPWPGTVWRALLLIALGVSMVEWLTWHRSLTL